jgi:hypothetical protein
VVDFEEDGAFDEAFKGKLLSLIRLVGQGVGHETEC